jgi:hypothetical protein
MKCRSLGLVLLLAGFAYQREWRLHSLPGTMPPLLGPVPKSSLWAVFDFLTANGDVNHGVIQFRGV